MTNERRNTTQPTDWWAAWEAAAKSAGLSLAAWIGKQCNRSLPKEVRDQLSERATPGQPRKNNSKKS
jgi:hypothetical protein